MISKQERWQEDLFVAGPLSSLIPEDHILKRVDAILDLSWLATLVKDTYCLDNGQRSIDPESALQLMLAGFFEGITQDRKLMRQAQVNLATRWVEITHPTDSTGRTEKKYRPDPQENDTLRINTHKPPTYKPGT